MCDPHMYVKDCVSCFNFIMLYLNYCIPNIFVLNTWNSYLHACEMLYLVLYLYNYERYIFYLDKCELPIYVKKIAFGIMF